MKIIAFSFFLFIFLGCLFLQLPELSIISDHICCEREKIHIPIAFIRALRISMETTLLSFQLPFAIVLFLACISLSVMWIEIPYFMKVEILEEGFEITPHNQIAWFAGLVVYIMT